jgi:glycosyltransferase involved in cell wall biosynthesis
VRIALVASLLLSDSRGGAEAYVEAAAHLLSENHEVRIFTGSADVVDGIPTVRIPRLPGFHQSDRPAPYRLAWHARDQWMPSVHRALDRELTRWRPDVVMSHHPQGLSAAVFTAIGRSGIPHVHMAHDLNILCARTSMTRGGQYCGGQCTACLVQRRIRSWALRLNISRLMCVSDYVCARHVDLGVVPQEKTTVIRLGAEPGTKRVRRLDGAGPRLGFIGTLSPHKGILTLLKAFEEAPPHWRLLVAGSGPLTDEVEAAAAADGRIAYLGHVEHGEKDAFFDALDLLVIPSEWEEPATFVAIEGALRGLPALVSDRGGLPENPEVRTFQSRDPRALLRAARSYVDDADGLEATSRRLLERSDEFTWAAHIEKVEALFDEVVAEAAVGAA